MRHRNPPPPDDWLVIVSPSDAIRAAAFLVFLALVFVVAVLLAWALLDAV